jgi:hypothetical protein
MTPAHHGAPADAHAKRALVAVVYSACLVGAAGWYALQQLHITIGSPPTLPAERTARLRIYLDYFASTVPQQCAAIIVASAGFAAFYVLTHSTTALAAAHWPASLCRLGATLYITAQLVQIGGYRRALEAPRTAGRDLTADLVTLQLVDAIDDALEIGAFAVLATGMLGLGAAARRNAQARRWALTSMLTGLLYLTLAGAMALAAWTVVDVLMILGGTVAAPVWAVLLIRALAATATAEATASPDLNYSSDTRLTRTEASPLGRVLPHR